MIRKLIRVLHVFLRRTFLEVPKQTKLLFIDKSLTIQPSFYPEASTHKTRGRVLWDQFLQIVKYGAPEQFYFMYGFDTKSRKEMSQYMHLYPFMKIRTQMNLLSSHHNASCLLRNKLYFGFFAKCLGVKTGNNIALVTKNSVLRLTDKNWLTIDEFLKYYRGKLFCKKLDGECGEDIFVLELTDQLISINGETVTNVDVAKIVEKSTYLMQERVLQHHDMNRLYPKSLNTIRLVTIKNRLTGKIQVFPSNLRIGAHGSFVDNGSQGGIAVGFDLKTGRLYEYGLQKPPYGTKTKTHPDTGIEFSSFVIPFIKEAEEQAVFLHSMLDSIYSVGWDIAITENGPLFIEGNDNWELQAIQRTHGGLKREFLEALGINYNN